MISPERVLSVHMTVMSRSLPQTYRHNPLLPLSPCHRLLSFCPLIALGGWTEAPFPLIFVNFQILTYMYRHLDGVPDPTKEIFTGDQTALNKFKEGLTGPYRVDG
jgi:hypothetical protein